MNLKETIELLEKDIESFYTVCRAYTIKESELQSDYYHHIMELIDDLKTKLNDCFPESNKSVMDHSEALNIKGIFHA